MKYKISAHPTQYAGVNFRSRLEARWAAFFDLRGWRWEYEPIDLQGWVPDFRLTLSSTKSHSEYYGMKFVRDPHPFVEVKPVDLVACGDSTPGLFEAFSVDKIYRAYTGTVLLLGQSPDYVWRIPDRGADNAAKGLDIDCAVPLYAGGDTLWREAGNRTQWKPRKQAAPSNMLFCPNCNTNVAVYLDAEGEKHCAHCNTRENGDLGLHECGGAL